MNAGGVSIGVSGFVVSSAGGCRLKMLIGEPSSRVAQTLLERHPRMPVERLPGECGINDTRAQITRPMRTVLQLRKFIRRAPLPELVPDLGPQQVRQPVYVGWNAGADIECMKASRELVRQSQNIRARDVGPVNVITIVLAITVDSGWLAAQQALTEDGHDAGFAMRILAWAVNVGVAQRDCGNAMLARKELQVLLTGPLADAIRRDGIRRGVFLLGGENIALQDAAGRRKHDARHTDADGVRAHLQQPKDIDLRIKDRLANRAADRHLSRLVANCIGPDFVKDRRNARAVTHIGRIQWDVRGQSLACAGR